MGNGRILVALVMAGIALFSYFSSKSYNPVTDEEQYIAITRDQEIALGLQSRPQMMQQHGGLLNDPDVQDYVDYICDRILSNSAAMQAEWPYECHVLADGQTVNAFALPGGQMFLTLALYNQLETEGQVAGVMAHEIGHVVARHSAQQIAKAQLTQGLTGAAILAAYDPDNPRSAATAQMVAMIGQVVNMKYGRDDELESDQLGVWFMSEAVYDPRALIDVMQILDEASSGSRPPEFLSTHPNPDNRIEQIELAIDQVFPAGVPNGLTQ
ncbi:MAG: M48 family peptidase [Chloroflexi bacterium]|nr:MAG: M48 family peptidase [Chloroflexota bacterium]